VKPNAPGSDLVSLFERLLERHWLLGALGVAAASVWVAFRAQRWLGRRSLQRRAARAQRAERRAAGLLEARGYEVLGRQVRKTWSLSADGEEVPFTLIADYLVQGRGRRWVAEVKTGERALDLRHGPTRRQLLEYREAFDVEGVLLVDAEGQTVRSVHFHKPARGGGVSGLAWFGAGLVVGLALFGYWSQS
jgi:hypothetical protein